MKIVIATTSGFHLRHLARELIGSGHDVTYLTYLPKFRVRRDGIPAARARSFFWALAPRSAAALFRHWPAMQRRAVLDMLRAADEAYADALPPCDVFIGLSAMADKSARAARRKYGAKVIIERGSTHVLTQSELIAAGGEPLPAVYVERELASYAAADVVTVLSTHALDSFVAHGFERARLFKNVLGVDLARFQPTRRPALPLRLLFVGQWSFRKGCDAIADLLRRSPELSLTHVGLPFDLALPNLPNFRSVGHKTHAELSRLMGEHHMLLLPSREDGFGMVLTEALASGLPVVASHRTGAPDLAELIVDKRAIAVIPPADAEALAGAITKMAGYVAQQDETRVLLNAADRDNLSWAAYARRYSRFLAAVA